MDLSHESGVFSNAFHSPFHSNILYHYLFYAETPDVNGNVHNLLIHHDICINS